MNEKEMELTLPDDIVAEVLGETENCTAFVRNFLSSGNREKEKARQKLLQEGKLKSIKGFTSQIDASEVEGVDGSYHIVNTAALDIAVCSAISVGKDICHKVKVFPSPHSQFLSRSCQGIMTMLELHIISESSAPLIVYDGSFISVLTRINSTLAAREEHSGDSLWAQVDRILEELASQKDCYSIVLKEKKIIACPKLSTSTYFLELHFPSLKGLFSDRSFFTAVLEPEEYVIEHRKLSPTNLARTSRFRPPDAQEVEKFYENVGIIEIFFKPHIWSPAYKIEIPAAINSEQIPSILVTFKALFSDPSMLEPYPQFLADSICKQIGTGADALRDAVESTLCLEGFGAEAVHSALADHRTTFTKIMSEGG